MDSARSATDRKQRLFGKRNAAKVNLDMIGRGRFHFFAQQRARMPACYWLTAPFTLKQLRPYFIDVKLLESPR